MEEIERKPRVFRRVDSYWGFVGCDGTTHYGPFSSQRLAMTAATIHHRLKYTGTGKAR